MAQRKRELSALADVLTAVSAYLVALRVHVGDAGHGALAFWYVLLTVVVAATWWLLSVMLRREASYRLATAGAEIRETLAINALGALVVLSLSLLVHAVNVSRLVLAGFPVLSAVEATLLRLGVRVETARRRRAGLDLKHVLLVGPYHLCQTACAEMVSPESGFRFAGCVVPPEEWGAGPWLPAQGVLGSYDDFPHVLHGRVIDQVGVVAPLDHPALRGIMAAALREGKAVWLHLDAFWGEVFGRRDRVSRIVSVSPDRDVWGRAAKRLTDVFGAACALTIMAPVIAVAAVAIKLSDPRAPVIFRQTRLGLHGRPFACYKLRTMVPSAEALQAQLWQENEMDGPVFKMRHDPRVTRVGRVLRKYSVDELPQLWNVLKGDMSLVGPRPPLPGEVDLYGPAHRRRLAVRPGLTGPWQVGGRNALGFEEWMALDLDYVDRWSFWTDLAILLRTVVVVLQGSGV